MTAKEKILKWPFTHRDYFQEDYFGNRIFYTDLFCDIKVNDMIPIMPVQKKVETILTKVEMKNGDVIEF